MGLEVAKYLIANAEVRQSMMKKHAAERLWREEDTAPLINFLDKNPEFQSKVKVLVDSKSAGLDPRRGRK
ncbi:hypothetical protein FRC02_008644 [Tulasnella sp. 418]|nr:hypothetical protein FRC02_008644 [Tulasnella sp. 418]